VRWRNPHFWLHFIVGCFITYCFLAVVAGFVGLHTSLSDGLGIPVWLVVSAMILLSLVSGFEFARQRTRPIETRGFPVNFPNKDATQNTRL
jgi:hypothetical protein